MQIRFHHWYYFWHREWGRTIFNANDPDVYAVTALAGEVMLVLIGCQLLTFSLFDIEWPRVSGWFIFGISAAVPFLVYGRVKARDRLYNALRQSSDQPFYWPSQVCAVSTFVFAMLSAFSLALK